MSTPGLELQRLFTVIARPRQTETYQYHVSEALHEIADALSEYGLAAKIFNVGPNYIIEPNDHRQQMEILSWSPLHTINLTVDLVPWCREHELTQLPWIIDHTEATSTVLIDPLAILPTSTARRNYSGNHALKDNFASMLDADYDLRTPDFSYLMTTELKNYFSAKHACITTCRDTAFKMASQLEDFYPHLNSVVHSTCTAIQQHCTNNLDGPATWMNELVEQLTSTTNHATTKAAAIDNAIQSIRKLSTISVQLEGFRHIPSLTEVPVPSSYPRRLKTIFKAATKRVYGQEGTITAAETLDGKYEACVSMGGHAMKYREVPLKTAGAAETVASYQALKFLSNMCGYKIMDLNYPTLALLISAINKYNIDIISLQYCVNDIIDHTEAMYQAYISLKGQLAETPRHLVHLSKIEDYMQQLISFIERHHRTMTADFHAFMESKFSYLHAHVEAQLLTAIPI